MLVTTEKLVTPFFTNISFPMLVTAEKAPSKPTVTPSKPMKSSLVKWLANDQE